MAKQKMEMDTRLEAIKALIEQGRITSFSQILNHIKKTPFTSAIGMNYQTLQTRLEHPATFVMEEIISIAYKIDIDYRTIINLVVEDIESRKKKR